MARKRSDRRHWDDAEIESELRRLIALYGAFPTQVQMDAAVRGLSLAVQRRGGSRAWAGRLGFPLARRKRRTPLAGADQGAPRGERLRRTPGAARRGPRPRWNDARIESELRPLIEKYGRLPTPREMRAAVPGLASTVGRSGGSDAWASWFGVPTASEVRDPRPSLTALRRLVETMSPGEWLPRIEELATQLNVDRTTVSSAIGELAAEGRLVSRGLGPKGGWAVAGGEAEESPSARTERLLRDLLDQLSPGERLPTVAALAARWRVDPARVSRALKQLAKQGRVVNRGRGKGWFLAGRERPWQRAVRLLRRLVTGMPPGGKLPSTAELCARFRVTTRPLYRALRLLAEEGLVVTRGRGQFGGWFVQGDRCRFDWSRPESRQELITAVAVHGPPLLGLIDEAESTEAQREAHGQILWFPRGARVGLALRATENHRLVLLAAGERERCLARATGNGGRDDRRVTVAPRARRVSRRRIAAVARDWIEGRLSQPAGVARIAGLTLVAFPDERLLVVTGEAEGAEGTAARAEAERLARLPELLREGRYRTT